MSEQLAFFEKIRKVFIDDHKCDQSDADIINNLVSNKFKTKLDGSVRKKCCKIENSNATKCTLDVKLAGNAELEIFHSEPSKTGSFKNELNYSSLRTRNVGTSKCRCAQKNKRSPLYDSIGTSHISSLITDLNSTYSSFAKNLCQGNSTLAESNMDTEMLFSEQDEFFELWDSKSADLVKEADKQLQIIFETSKAVNTCLSLKEFLWGPEYLEAEKILLLADFKRQQILDKLIEIPNDEEKISEINSVGEIALLDIRFPVESDWDLNYNFVFVMIASCQNVAVVSEIAYVDKEDCIRFRKIFHFENLLPDFEIHIGIYSMQVKNKLRNYSHESKFHLKEETAICLSPSKLFQKSSSNPTTISKDCTRRRSSFSLLGTSTIRIANLTRGLPIFLKRNSNCSFLKPNFYINFQSNVKFTSTCSRFLTLGIDINEIVSWNRYWCVINGYTLNFWNYPGQEDTKPTESIDLRCCTRTEINAADRKVCARPRTLLLKIKSLHYDFVYYLSTDTTKDMHLLKEKLNTILAGLHYWNCMKS